MKVSRVANLAKQHCASRYKDTWHFKAAALCAAEAVGLHGEFSDARHPAFAKLGPRSGPSGEFQSELIRRAEGYIALHVPPAEQVVKPDGTSIMHWTPVSTPLGWDIQGNRLVRLYKVHDDFTIVQFMDEFLSVDEQSALLDRLIQLNEVCPQQVVFVKQRLELERRECHETSTCP